MCLYGFIIITFVAVFIWSAGGTDRFRRWTAARIGAAAVGFGFLSLPWLYFSWVEWLDLLVNFSEAAEFGAYLIERAGIVRALRFINQWGGGIIRWLGWIPGWALFFVIPTFSFWLRLTLILVGITGLASVSWSWIAVIIPSTSLQQWGWRMMAGLSLTTALLLLTQLPAIESLGSAGTFLPGLAVWVSMVQMGWGVWVVWFGLLLLGAGSLLALSDNATSEDIDDDLYL